MSDKYSFIDAESALRLPGQAPSIALMCRWLAVSTSGFYDWRARPVSATESRRMRLRELIVKAFRDSDGTYGYRRITAQLHRWGVPVDAEVVRRLMRELHLVACQPKPWRPTTTR